MKFKFDKAPKGLGPAPVEVGNVYACHGGRGKGRSVWVVVGITNVDPAKHSRVTVLGVDEHGGIVSGATYGIWCFEKRPILGKCAGLDNLTFNVQMY